MRAAVLVSVALEHFAVRLQFLPVKINDFGERVVGIVLCDYELYAEGVGKKAQIRGADALVFVLIMMETRAVVERQARISSICVVTHMQIAVETPDVEK